MSNVAAQQTLSFEPAPLNDAHLTQWPPLLAGLDEHWAKMVRGFFASSAGGELNAKLENILAAGHVVYPPDPLLALRLTPLQDVRVVILGQDPYHGPGQAQGLAFSVAPGVRVPPSLRNIFKELARSLAVPIPAQGSLEHWAKQGVLLLNACLTVEAGQPGSHARLGWETLTDAMVKAVAQRKRPAVFMLWGAHAQAKKMLIDAADPEQIHLVLQANHPSPLSAMRPPVPFIGCGHFVQADQFLKKNGGKPIEW
ncbi:uracil-DNA glycosylase [Limnohabitans sp. T6-5]|uniref:uracil-DNA glycosylase n=1 Tax=Limnohabitans sp. T6-5 TaxID=1100724 RepID=UPI000D3495BD|nr:uracil-DNA glycosylase [Limnohabitans sp. T6-5]PUE06423.1 uracil-DNA glycosylase [Limnohabitans sp. T6-5]